MLRVQLPGNTAPPLTCCRFGRCGRIEGALSCLLPKASAWPPRRFRPPPPLLPRAPCRQLLVLGLLCRYVFFPRLSRGTRCQLGKKERKPRKAENAIRAPALAAATFLAQCRLVRGECGRGRWGEIFARAGIRSCTRIQWILLRGEAEQEEEERKNAWTAVCMGRKKETALWGT